MKKLILILLVAGMVNTGCKKYIDGSESSVLTTGVLFNTTRDLESLLSGAYGALANGNTLAGNWRLFPELLADQVVVNVSEPTAADPYVALYNRNMAQAVYTDNWKLAYVAIQNANTILYAIDNNFITKEKDAAFNDATRDRMRGEALFIRGLVHFELVRLYGHQFGFNSTAPNSGIVLRTQPILNVETPADIAGAKRATVAEVYTSVINDLKQAETLLPLAVTRRGRPAAAAAAAYLARVYFQQTDYDNALVQINKVIGDSAGFIRTEFKLVRTPATGTLTAAQVNANVLAAFNTTGNTDKNAETIFDLVSVTNAAVNGTISRKYVRTTAIEPHLAISSTFITEAAFAANDGRKAGLITTVGTKNYTKKYDRSLQNIPVLRSAELVLDRAEIFALKGNTADATKDINMIRDRAIPSYNINTVITPANILTEVRRERIRELAFEGDRLHNLRRLQVDIGVGNRTGATPLPWNSNQLLFKIPADEIAASNGTMPQNPD